MTTIHIDPNLLRAAIKALNITAPIYSATYVDTNGGAATVAIATRDGDTIWHPGAEAAVSDAGGNCKQPSAVAADDLTLIPQIGAATQAALNKHGIYTFADLHNADTNLLLSIMPRRALRCVSQFIQTHHPELLAPTPKE